MDLLQEIKNRLSVTDDFHNDLLTGFAEDVKAYMLSAGVKQTVIDDRKSIGCIAKGVSDMWINGSFSELFKQRVIQLTFEKEIENV